MKIVSLFIYKASMGTNIEFFFSNTLKVSVLFQNSIQHLEMYVKS